MSLNSDYKELLVEFLTSQIKFLVVGGYAVMHYAEPRYTKDIDLLVKADEENGRKVYAALARFGAPLQDVPPDTFCKTGHFYIMGVAPSRIDILTSISGVNFDSAWSKRVLVNVDSIEIPFISKEDLIAAKTASGRKSDLADIEALQTKPTKRKILRGEKN